MPTQSRGFFACDYCGLQHDTIEEATEHEQTQCPQALAVAAARRPINSIFPPQYPYFLQQQPGSHRHGFTTGMGPLGAEGAEAYPYARPNPYSGYGGSVSPAPGITAEASYPRKSGALGALLSSAQSSTKIRCFPLVSYPSDPSAERLNMIDKMACHNIEVFEANAELVGQYEQTSPDTGRIESKQVGLRCRNCGFGTNNTSGSQVSTAAEAIVFPSDIASMGECVRKISDFHFVSCSLTNPEVKAACQDVAAKRQQRGMTGMAEGTDTGDDQASKAALGDYCANFCQQLGITRKENNKSGLEFIGSSAGQVGDSSVPPSQSGGETSTAPFNRPGAYGAPPQTSEAGQQSYPDGPTDSFPFYQESDRTWQCKYCSYLPHNLRDSHAIWSSPSGDPPPSRFIDQHMSICRAYRQYRYSPIPPGGGILPPGQSSFGMLPAGYPNPSSAQYGLPGQSPYPPSAWEATAAAGGMGAMHPQHMQYPSTGLLAPHQDPNYRYGQAPPPVILPPNSMDAGAGGGRFLPTLGRGDNRGGYPDRPIVPSLPPAASRGTSFGRASADGSSDSMKDAMTFLRNYEADIYARDPASAAIPKLVLDEDHLLLTDYFFWLMKQLRLVRFTENDRKTRGGKREKIKIGYGGLQCIHCADLPMSRKFFWSNVDRLANSFAEIPGHVLKCRRCPQANKDALMRLKQGHPDQMSKLPRGSQKIFFRRMWRRLHEGDPQDDTVGVESPEKASPLALERRRPPVPSIKTSPEKSIEDLSHSGSITVLSDETILVMQRSAKEAARALKESARKQSGPPSPSSRILVAIPEDKEWLSDIDSYVRKQLEVFCATEADVLAAQADRKYPISVGQVGIRCIHCAIMQGNDAIGHAIAYPFSISGIYESVKEFHRLHLDSCPNLPATTKSKLDSMKGASSLSSVLRKYYTLAAKALGLVDTKDGIRTGGESTPIGSLAAFTFAETEDEAGESKTKSTEDKDAKLPGRKKQEGTEEGSFDEAAASTSRGTKRSGSPSEPEDTDSRSKLAKRESDPTYF